MDSSSETHCGGMAHEMFEAATPLAETRLQLRIRIRESGRKWGCDGITRNGADAARWWTECFRGSATSVVPAGSRATRLAAAGEKPRNGNKYRRLPTCVTSTSPEKDGLLQAADCDFRERSETFDACANKASGKAPYARGTGLMEAPFMSGRIDASESRKDPAVRWSRFWLDDTRIATPAIRTGGPIRRCAPKSSMRNSPAG